MSSLSHSSRPNRRRHRAASRSRSQTQNPEGISTLSVDASRLFPCQRRWRGQDPIESSIRTRLGGALLLEGGKVNPSRCESAKLRSPLIVDPSNFVVRPNRKHKSIVVKRCCSGHRNICRARSQKIACCGIPPPPDQRNDGPDKHREYERHVTNIYKA